MVSDSKKPAPFFGEPAFQLGLRSARMRGCPFGRSILRIRSPCCRC